jgi:uncharacterized membrane protein
LLQIPTKAHIPNAKHPGRYLAIYLAVISACNVAALVSFSQAVGLHIFCFWFVFLTIVLEAILIVTWARSTNTQLVTSLLYLIVLTIYTWALAIVLNNPPSAQGLDIGEAVKASVIVLLHGKDPYAATYNSTSLANVLVYDLPINPAWFHYVYFPFTTLLALPFVMVLGSAFRLHFVLFFALALSLVFLSRDIDKSFKQHAIIMFALSPLLITDVVFGYDDIIFLSFVIAAIVMLRKHKLLFSGILLGIACATKQTALLILPFLMAYVWRKNGITPSIKYSCYTLVTLGLFVVPFFLWNERAFINSTFFYLGSGGVFNYPVHGAGLAGLMLKSNILKSRWQPFPFIIPELAAYSAVCVIGINVLRKNPTIHIVVYTFGIAILAASLFSRSFQPDYFSLSINVLLLGLAFHTPTLLAPTNIHSSHIKPSIKAAGFYQ